MSWGLYNDMYGEAWAMTFAGQFIVRHGVAADYDAPEGARKFRTHRIESPGPEAFLAGNWVNFLQLIGACYQAFRFFASLSQAFGDGERVTYSVQGEGFDGKWMAFTENHGADEPMGPSLDSGVSRYWESTASDFRARWRSDAIEAATESCDLFTRDSFRVSSATISKWFDSFDAGRCQL